MEVANPPTTGQYDVVIVGAGPVGLAIAIELSRLDLTTLVVDRRPPPAEDPGVRPQLLVARADDVDRLDHLGVDTDDPRIVAPITTTIAAQPSPVALVPIGRLQRALLERALAGGVAVRYGCDVTRLRRHARDVSLACADGSSVRAGVAIVATGAARAVVSSLGLASNDEPGRRLIAGVFEATGEVGSLVRVELPVSGFARFPRCTMLQSAFDSDAGTALVVDARIAGGASDGQLHFCFDAIAREHGLAGTPYRVPPRIFTTSVTALARRVVAGDNRAPVVVAGDAAQTGHVFTGQSCFVNLELGLALVTELARARSAVVDRAVNAPALLHALARYESRSAVGADVLARASRPF
jgi:2-polyprenyl-6-methoxyphenol hydroxylase-like FAD-dependent oxidoreductase